MKKTLLIALAAAFLAAPLAACEAHGSGKDGKAPVKAEKKAAKDKLAKADKGLKAPAKAAAKN